MIITLKILVLIASIFAIIILVMTGIQIIKACINTPLYDGKNDKDDTLFDNDKNIC